ncbi:hypothetical protein AYR62_14970 [Secundilactobacillus paracollinoides]|uniref:Uncharacterized protein n=1 Tax=Secundilactobacillus paracollinoides TaxID=240427 RepID=A0A1B2IXF6_9LACO|nr:hypothetical protein AYR61_05585 [Secundilactobacillus paracollinoides]ANZ65251.1 hypothetical protein AYR62_14970 [Secundilactobacillus paracollinoides]ANZ66721.1 hypothetical protein AYR63_05955 [Secundilactobacillus paracollinoides]
MSDFNSVSMPLRSTARPCRLRWGRFGAIEFLIRNSRISYVEDPLESRTAEIELASSRATTAECQIAQCNGLSNLPVFNTSTYKVYKIIKLQFDNSFRFSSGTNFDIIEGRLNQKEGMHLAREILEH